MVNQCVDFLKSYARENNMTYSCAISDKTASVAYRNMKQGGNSKRKSRNGKYGDGRL